MTDKSLSEVLYNDEKLGNHSLRDICSNEISYNIGDNPEQWCFVRAQTGHRGVPMKSRGIYVILQTKECDRLIENLDTDDKDANYFEISEIVDAMPRRERRMRVVPSVRGEYLTIKEVTGTEDSSGRVKVQKSKGQSSKIPVEYVIEPLTYDEVVLELIENQM